MREVRKKRRNEKMWKWINEQEKGKISRYEVLSMLIYF